MNSSRGFTLAEVLIAVAVTAMIGGLVWGSFHQGFQAREMIEQEAELYREIRIGTNRLVREISMAFVSNNYDATRFTSSRPTLFAGEDDRLTFSMLGHQRLSRDAKESDQSIVSYKIDRNPDEKDSTALLRCEKPVLDDEPERCEGWEVLLSGISNMELRYWDSKRKEWVREWDTRRNEYADQLPERVRIELTGKNELNQEQKYVTQSRIALIQALERR